MALAVAALRVPPVARSWSDAELASRLLVVHVDLGVIVWFLALPAALFHLLALARTEDRPVRPTVALAPWLATIGAVMLLAGLVPGLGTPHPVNYIPLVTHPVYMFGLGLFLAGVALTFLDRPLVGRRGPATAGSSIGIAGGSALPGAVASTLTTTAPLARLGALYFLLALVTLGLAYAALPDGLVGEARSEVLMWGPGHVLQYTNVAFALLAWALLAAWASGRALTGRRAVLAVALALAVSLVPILALLPQGPATIDYREGFTRLMQWGLFPAVAVFLGLVLLPHFLSRHSAGATALSRAALWPLVASVVLMLVGFLFGALIRGSDLRIPGHYHACIGAVTLAYMALTLLLADSRAGARARAPSRAGGDAAVRWVAILYGTGQLVFSSGLFVAGSYGLGRKTYGTEQVVANLGQGVGLAVMAVGGTLALAGGVTWAIAALRRLHGLMRHREREPAAWPAGEVREVPTPTRG